MNNIIKNPDENSAKLVISGDNIPFGAYQAIYHRLTKKVEQRKKTYRDAYTIKFSDIQNLHQRLVQVTQQYSVKSSRCQITHQLRDDTSREHSSFERFRISDCSVRSCTARIHYEFDFLVVLPPEVPEASEIAQRYTVSILLDQDFIDEDDFDAPYFVRGLMIGRNIQVVIEFSDYSVSQTLQATVDGWVGTLPTQSLGRFARMIFSLEKPARRFADTFVRSIVLFVGAIGAYKAVSFTDGLYIVLFSMALAFFLFSVVDGIVDKLYEQLSKIKPSTSLLITDGDRARASESSTKIRSTKGVISFLAIGIFASVAISVFSNYLYDAMKAYLIN